MFLMVAFVVLFVSMSVFVVEAGILTGTRSVGSGGTTFTLSYYQGCGPTSIVRFGNNVNFPNPGLSLGPNQCNLGAPDGNNRAIHCLIGSRAAYTSGYVDAMVNCSSCPCESVFETHFWCLSSTQTPPYSCEQCDRCLDEPCDHLWQCCDHINCHTRDCYCCSGNCNENGDWGSCSINTGGRECGTFSGTQSREVKRCHDGRDGSCTWQTETSTCTETVECGSGALGPWMCCSDGSCNYAAGCCAVDCPSSPAMDRCLCLCDCNCGGDIDCYYACAVRC